MSPSESSPSTVLPVDASSELETASTTTLNSTTSNQDTSKASIEFANSSFQIFLGGSCNPTTWRQNVAIPFLEMKGISYYNPQIDNWTPDVVKTERRAKQNAKILLFVIDKQTRSTVSIVESAFMAADNNKLVLVIYPFDYDVLSMTDTTTKQTSNVTETRSEQTTTSLNSRNLSHSRISSSSSSSSTTVTKYSSGLIKINDETISLGEFQELKRARFILKSLVARRRVPMFSDLSHALKYVSSNLNKSTTSNIQDDALQDPSRASQDKESRFAGGDRSDVYLTVDEDDTSSVSSIITILKEKGLTFNILPLNKTIESHAPATKSALLKNPDNSPLSVTSLEDDCQRCQSGPLIDPSKPQQEQDVGLAFDRDFQNSRVLLFVITNKCRGLSVMVLASHFMALFKSNVVLCIQYLEEPCSINGEVLTKSAIADYNRGRVYLCEYAIKSQVPVFSSLREAIDCCSRRCGSKSISVDDKL